MVALKNKFLSALLITGILFLPLSAHAENEYGACNYGNQSYQINCPKESSSGGGGIVQRLAPPKTPTPPVITPTPVVPSITPIIPSTGLFTRYLKLGMEGADVKSLQELLNKKGFTVAILGPGSSGSETTRFGAATQAALAKFQAANQISPALGYIGPKTLETLNKLSSLNTSSESPATTPASEFSFTQDLSAGVTHPDIKKLQQFLNTHGFPVAYSGVGSLGKETNYFGLATKFALTKFQEAYASEILAPSGLTRGNGRLGPKTREKINILLKSQ